MLKILKIILNYFRLNLVNQMINLKIIKFFKNLDIFLVDTAKWKEKKNSIIVYFK